MIRCSTCHSSRWVYLKRAPVARLARFIGLSRYGCKACGRRGWHVSRRRHRAGSDAQAPSSVRTAMGAVPALAGSRRITARWVVAIGLGIAVLLFSGLVTRPGASSPFHSDDLVRMQPPVVVVETPHASASSAPDPRTMTAPPHSVVRETTRATAPQPRRATTARRGSTAVPRFHGSLAVDSDPAGALVSVDGRVVGATPLLLKAVPAGSRVVRIESDGFERWSFAARVVANQQVRVVANLQRGADQ
jgi:hypothetical protein